MELWKCTLIGDMRIGRRVWESLGALALSVPPLANDLSHGLRYR